MHRILAFIGRNWPLDFGTGWLVERPSRLIKKWPHDQVIRLKDGRVFQGDLNDRVFRDLYLYGTYEQVVTSALSLMIKQGDNVIDVGANIGIISVLMARLVGTSGKVVSFEPVPRLYNILEQTIALNRCVDIVVPHQVVVCDGSQETIQIYTPNERSHACSSLKVAEPASATVHACSTISLDKIDATFGLPSLIKVDVEGAEMSVLQGSIGLCSKKQPPIWVLEVNRSAANRFEYMPEDLVTWLAHYNYDYFWWSDEKSILPFEVGSSFISDGMLYALPQWAIDEGRTPL